MSDWDEAEAHSEDMIEYATAVLTDPEHPHRDDFSAAARETIDGLLKWIERLSSRLSVSCQRNAFRIATLNESLKAAERGRDEKTAYIQALVAKVAENRLDGYRALGQRALDAEVACEAERRKNDLLQGVIESLKAEAKPCPVDHDSCSRCGEDTRDDDQVFVLCDPCWGATVERKRREEAR